eukprot:g2756.t1
MPRHIVRCCGTDSFLVTAQLPAAQNSGFVTSFSSSEAESNSFVAASFFFCVQGRRHFLMKLNGRAAMLGFTVGLVVEAVSLAKALSSSWACELHFVVTAEDLLRFSGHLTFTANHDA